MPESIRPDVKLLLVALRNERLHRGAIVDIVTPAEPACPGCGARIEHAVELLPLAREALKVDGLKAADVIQLANFVLRALVILGKVPEAEAVIKRITERYPFKDLFNYALHEGIA